MFTALDQAISNARTHLLSLRTSAGHWEGTLASSALATATAIVALHQVNARQHAAFIQAGSQWLQANANADGGWGDTTISKSNLSTTLLCWSALRLCSPESPQPKCESWITQQVGSLEPQAISRAVIARYGKDKTFSVPILMLCAIGGTLGEKAWRYVLPLPFELAALPRSWFGAVGLPVVSYALPALIAIGYARFRNAPRSRLHPWYWLRRSLWKRISPMLKSLQPSSGGYLEATPLTSFVTMALASAGEAAHPCIPKAVDFLRQSMRPDGSWPIDTNLATWGTTLASRALWRHSADGSSQSESERHRIRDWLLQQQYREVHPFTHAAPGGWAWTDLPGGVPDADDTSGALIALWYLNSNVEQRSACIPAIEAGIRWLLDLQNRDGGMPTFCRGWGALPFDRSTPEITAHALLAFHHWSALVSPELQQRMRRFKQTALRYLERSSLKSVGGDEKAWHPLWFGNEQTSNEENPVFGTCQVLKALKTIRPTSETAQALAIQAEQWLLKAQHVSGGWGGNAHTSPSIEETALAVETLATDPEKFSSVSRDALLKGVAWLLQATKGGTHFPASPIGLYFARLWYHEQLYPIIWTLQALTTAKAALSDFAEPDRTLADSSLVSSHSLQP